MVSLEAWAEAAPCSQPLVTSSLWLDVAKTFIGALLGAWLAFASSLHIQAKLRRDEHVKAGNVALSLLVGQMSDFLGVKKAFLKQRDEALKQSKDCPLWLQFRPTSHIFIEAELDVSSVAFLFSKKGTDAMQKLLYVQRLHRTLRSLVAEHREIRVLIQERTANLGIKPFDPIPMKDLEEKIGPYLLARAESAAKVLLKMFDEDEPEYEAAFRMVREQLIRTLGKRFIDMGTPTRPTGVSIPRPS
jgi:hypothetical protein